MNKNVTLLLTIFIIISSLKIAISRFISVPTMFSDEYFYFKMAHDLFFEHAITSSSYPPMYSLIISPAFLSGNGYSAYFFAKVINSFLSTAIIFPSFLIVREFLSSKKAVLISLLIAFIPSHFVSSFYILSENLFYLLFLTSFYCIYKTIQKKTFAWSFGAGLLISLTILTKFSGIALIIVLFFAFFYALVKKETDTAKLILVPCIMAISSLGLWLLRNFSLNGFGLPSALGVYAAEITHPHFSLASFLIWLVLYAGIIILSLFFIPFFYNIKSIDFAMKSKNKNLLLFNVLLILITIITIIIASNHSAGSVIKSQTSLPWLTGRAIGRYVCCLLPLFIINGFIGFKNNKTKIESKLILAALIIVTLISSQLVFFQLLPINNSDLSWLGAAFLALNKLTSNIAAISIIFAAALMCMFYFSFKISDKINFSKFFAGMLCLFLFTNVLAIGVTYYRSEKIWQPLEQTQLGLWLSENSDSDSVLLIDKRDCNEYDLRNIRTLCSKNNGANLIGFWFNGKILIGDNIKDADFIVSEHDFNLSILKETANEIRIYDAK